MEHIFNFDTDRQYLIALNVLDGTSFRLATFDTVEDCLSMCACLRAVIQSAPVTFGNIPSLVNAGKVDRNVPSIEQDTQPELDGFTDGPGGPGKFWDSFEPEPDDLNTDSDTIESEVTGS